MTRRQPGDISAAVIAALRHRHILAVNPAGSRATGTPTALSDWDFHVHVDDFPVVAADLPALVAPLDPLAQQWDRLSPEWCYMLMLPGPAKVDLIFDRPHEDEPPWTVTAETLPGIDAHFWDWILWTASKQLADKSDTVGRELAKMSLHLLRPLGIEDFPRSIREAVDAYREARGRWESRLGVTVRRRLEDEVEPVLPDR